MTGTFLPHDMPDGTPLKRKRGRPKGSMGSAKQALVPPSPASPVVIGAAPTNRGRPRKSMTPSKMTVVRELGGPGPSSSAFPAPPPVPQRLASPTRQVVSPAGRIPDTTTAPSPVPITPAVPRGRGRPRKHPVGVTFPRAPPAVKSTAAQTSLMQMPPMQMPPMASTVLPGGAAAAVPRGRGRPRKHPQTETDVRSKQPKQPMPAAGAPKRPVGRPRKVPEITTSPGLRNGSPGRVPVAATAPTTATAAAVPRHDPPGPSMPLEKNTAGPSATPRRAKLPKLPKIPKIRVVQLVPESVKRQRKNHGSLIQALTASDSDDSRDTESESDSEDARRNGVQRTEQTSPSRERVRTSPARRIVSSDLNNPSNARPAPSGGGGMPPGAFPLPQSLLQHHLDYGVDDYMGADAVRDEPQMDAVVKVFCSHTEPNFSLPWQRKRQSSSTSSGFIIGGNRVLTNAHSVEHHTQVKLKKRGEEKKYVARVLAVGTECDLALLSVDDVSFFQNVTPVRFGHLPSLQDSVTVVGYPIGGVAISVTQGVVSRIEVTAYSHGSSELLGLQIDAAINSGNSGGPAFNKDGECVGVAFQSLKHEDAENIGYVIPSPVIVHFLQDYARNGKYTGFPTLGVEWQKLENPDMRKFLKMRSLNERTEHGVYVRRVSPTSPAGALIQTTDVLLSFDGVPIANDGTVPFRTGERISFHYLVSEKYVGERAEVRFLRQGKVRTASLTLSTTPRLVPVHIPTETPTYFIVAGLVFTNVCVPYLKSEYGKDYDYDAPVRLLDTMMHDHVRFPGQNVVVLAQVLASDVTIGYEDIVNSVVKGFNGVAVNDLKQLAWMVDSCGEEFLRFQLEHEQLVVLKRTVAVKETKEILKTHGIPDAKSADLR